MSEYTDDGHQLDEGDSAAEARLARKALGLPDLEAARAKGREVVDKLVRDTASLPPEDVDFWLHHYHENVVTSFNAMADRPAEQVAFFGGYSEAAKEAMEDLAGYKDRLYGWDR